MVSNYRDSAGRALTDYPRPSVAVDTAVLTVSDAALCVLLAGSSRLPGTFLHEGETLADAVLRSLQSKVGISGLSPRQLHVFDDPSRDDRGWVISVAHLDAVPLARLSGTTGTLTRIEDVPALPYGHNEIISQAVTALRAQYLLAPDPAGFLPSPFTLHALRMLHSAVAGVELPRDTFRRLMEPQLVPTGELSSGSVGKPARLFRQRDAPV